MNTVDLSLIHSCGMNRMKVDASETEKGEGEYSYKDVNGTPGPLIDFCGTLAIRNMGGFQGKV